MEIDRMLISGMKGTPYAKLAGVADKVGATACVVLITKTEIFVANAGDSRCVLSKSGLAINMSEDHKPTLERERTRIMKAGGKVEEGRINGMLSLSRSIGDLDFKKDPKLKQEEQLMVPLPDVKVEKVANYTDFLIIACDGIWDCMKSQDAVDYVRMALGTGPDKKDKKLSAVAAAMMDKITPKAIDENRMSEP